MTVVLIGAGDPVVTGGTTLTPEIPSGTAVGDLLVGVWMARGPAQTVSVPAGWSAPVYVRNTASSGPSLALTTKVQESGEFAPTFTRTGQDSTGEVLMAQVIAFRGAAGVSGWGIPAASDGNAVTAIGPSLGVAVQAGGYALSVHAWSDDHTAVTTPGDWTQLGLLETTVGSDGSMVTLGRAYSAAGTTATATVTTSPAATFVAAQIAVTPTAPPVAAPSVSAGMDAVVMEGDEWVRTADEIGSSITSRSWTLVSGPVDVGLVLSTTATLVWTPDTVGNYTWRYSATNSGGTVTDDVVVTVTPAAQAYNRTVNDAAPIGDAVDTVDSTERLAVDAAAAGDSVTVALGKGASSADAALAGDAATASRALSRTVGDSAAIADAVNAARTGSTTSNAGDASPAADAATATRTTARTVGDTVGAADAASGTLGALAAPADAAGATDAAAATQGAVRTVADTVAAVDAAVLGGGTAATTDPAGAADAVARTVTTERTAGDVAPAVDAVSREVDHDRDVADTAPVADTALVARGRTVGDAAGVADGRATDFDAVRSPADAVQAGDTVAIFFERGDIRDYEFVVEKDDALRLPHVPFGGGQTIMVESFDPGMAEMRTQDQNSQVGDYRRFGVDRRTPPTWSWRLYTDIPYDVRNPERAAQDAHEWAQIMEDVWDAELLRSMPDGVVALRYRRAGQTRRVYGRPRDFTVIPTYSRTGRIDMVADFALAEHTYYADAEETLGIQILPSRGQGNGFTFPFTFPLRTQQDPEPRVEELVIGGRRPTWVDVYVQGPVQDPVVTVGGQRYALRGYVAGGRQNRVRLSGKPWQQGVQRDDGTWVPGMLTAEARLSQLRLPPGRYPVTFSGYDETGSARASLAWRAAYGTM